MSTPLIDTHAHLDDEQFRDDLPAVLARARSAGVGNIVTIAVSAPSSVACIALAERHPMLSASVGIHPNHITQAEVNAWDEVERLASHEQVVALGETGLDRHWNDTPFPQQEDFFARHLDLSRRIGKALVIHCREAEADVVRLLRADYERHGAVRGVMHSFAGSAETVEACLAMGLYISFAGMVTFKNAAALRAVAEKVPLDRLLIETDSPYLAPVPVRGKRNEPAFVAHTAECLARVRGVDVSVIGEQTTRNARGLFGVE